MSHVSLLDIQIPATDRFEIRLSGSGGQGMMLAAMLLSEAIGTDPRLNLVQTKSYGPEARGGACKADIVVSPNEIYYPKPVKLDLLLAMTQEALDKYYPDLKAQGTLIIDSTLVTSPPSSLHFAIPLTDLAREELQNVMVANVISLGAIAAITEIVPREPLTQAVLARAPRGTEEKNRLALEIGFREGAKLREREMYRAVPIAPVRAWRESMPRATDALAGAVH
jgi:2-oxoglutarate ferredoxin oxidoreductase subunit gamma